MKKITWISFLMAALPVLALAQSEDDMYFIPKKKTAVETPKTTKEIHFSGDKVVVKTSTPTTVVVRDSRGNARDVDEYNRRYSSKQYAYNVDNDTLYIDEKAQPDLDGEWVNDFQGTQDDYEYAARIIRFRNPRYAIPVSSPLYWDVVYGLNSWDWNVYSDGYYAYAFPTFSNRLWWNWRYGPSWSWGWGGYYGGYYGGWYAGWYDRPYYSWGSYHHHYYPHYTAWRDYSWRGGSNQRFAGGVSSRSRLAGRGSWGSRASVGVRDSRFSRGYVGTRGDYSQGVRSARVNGRVINSRVGGDASVRPSRSTTDMGSRNTNNGTYYRSRGSYGDRQSGTYSRPSSTRNSVYSSDRNSAAARYRSESPRSSSDNQTRSSRSYSSPTRSSSERSYSAPTRSSGNFSSGSRSGGSSFGGGSRGGSRGGGRR